MTELKEVSLRELAQKLSPNEVLNNTQICTVKGGCSSCEDTRRPPRIFGWSW